MRNLIFLSLFLLASTANAQRLTLMYFKSATCGPCRAFAGACKHPITGASTQFFNELERRYDVKPAIDVNVCPQVAQQNGIKVVPTFILLRNGVEVNRVTKFRNTAELLHELSQVQDIQQKQFRPTEPRLTPPRTIERPPPRDESREVELLKTNDYLQQTIEAMERDRQAERTSAKELRRLLNEKQTAFDVEVERLRRMSEQNRREAETIRSSSVSQIETIRTEASQRINELIAKREQAGRQSQTLNQQTLSPAGSMPQEQARPPTKSSPTWDKWKEWGTWGAGIALTLLAPEVAIPGSAGLAALGYGISWLRKRKQRQPILEPQPSPVEVVLGQSRDRLQTENHYITKEVDHIGNAYKEALRRVMAVTKDRSPGVVGLVKQVEHAAEEIIRGVDINKRPETPKSAVWSDTERAL